MSISRQMKKIFCVVYFEHFYVYIVHIVFTDEFYIKRIFSGKYDFHPYISRHVDFMKKNI